MPGSFPGEGKATALFQVAALIEKRGQNGNNFHQNPLLRSGISVEQSFIE
jgi:hypothetical protein